MAPELSSNLAAMRELANMSARAAIDKHAYRNWGRAAFGKLAIAVLAGAAGCGAIYFAAAPDSMLMYAGLSCFVVTLFWLLQAGILVKNVFMASRRNRFYPAVDQASQVSLALDAPAETAPLEADELPPAEVGADGDVTPAEISAGDNESAAAEISSVQDGEDSAYELPPADDSFYQNTETISTSAEDAADSWDDPADRDTTPISTEDVQDSWDDPSDRYTAPTDNPA
jgi:hypothetical protein